MSTCVWSVCLPVNKAQKGEEQGETDGLSELLETN